MAGAPAPAAPMVNIGAQLSSMNAHQQQQGAASNGFNNDLFPPGTRDAMDEHASTLLHFLTLGTLKALGPLSQLEQTGILGERLHKPGLFASVFNVGHILGRQPFGFQEKTLANFWQAPDDNPKEGAGNGTDKGESGGHGGAEGHGGLGQEHGAQSASPGLGEGHGSGAGHGAIGAGDQHQNQSPVGIAYAPHTSSPGTANGSIGSPTDATATGSGNGGATGAPSGSGAAGTGDGSNTPIGIGMGAVGAPMWPVGIGVGMGSVGSPYHTKMVGSGQASSHFFEVAGGFNPGAFHHGLSGGAARGGGMGRGA